MSSLAQMKSNEARTKSMCGRYSLLSPAKAVQRLFRCVSSEVNFSPRYNISPNQFAPVVALQDNGTQSLSLMKWGLIPTWSKSNNNRYSMFNARVETVSTKRAYSDAFKKRRCLVPTDGFYEWKKHGSMKEPYRISLTNEKVFAFGGLWERWENGSASVIHSFTILTTPANALISPIHARMPLILPPEVHMDWLSGFEPESFLLPYPAENMNTYPLDSYVNDAKHDDSRCLTPAKKRFQRDLFD